MLQVSDEIQSSKDFKDLFSNTVTMTKKLTRQQSSFERQVTNAYPGQADK